MGNQNTRLKLDNAAIEGIIEALKDENECLRREVDYLKKFKGLRSKRDGITEQDKAKVTYLTKFEGMEHIKIVLDKYNVQYNRKKNQSTVKRNKSSTILDSHSNSRLIFCLIL